MCTGTPPLRTNAFCRSRVRLYTQQDVVALEQAPPHPQLEDGLDGEFDPVPSIAFAIRSVKKGTTGLWHRNKPGDSLTDHN